MPLPSSLATLLRARFGGRVLAWLIAVMTFAFAGHALAQDADAGPDAQSTVAQAIVAEAVDGGADATLTQQPADNQPVIRLLPNDAEKAEGLPIVAIEVEGNRRVSQDDVGSYLRVKVGHLFKVDNLASDVRALWDSGFFNEIQVDLTTTDRGVRLRFKVEERPNIKSIDFEGNVEIDAEKLNEAIEIKPNTILSRPAVRRSLMPIERAHAFEEVIDACVLHTKKTGYSPMWAVTPLAGVNDSDDDARALADLAKSFTERAGKRPRISVIPFNAIEGDPFARSTRHDAFRDVMARAGVFSHARYSGAGDIAASCGQLAAKV